VACAVVWLAFGAWRGAPSQRFRDANFRLQCAWARALFGGASRLYGFRVEVEGRETLAPSPFLLFLRHASTADTLLPAVLVSAPLGIRLRYVLKRELLWDPCLDVVGNRLPNLFIDRFSEDSEREIGRVAALAAGLGPGEGVLIYPEGTRFSAEKRARILERLRASGRRDLAARAERLTRVLPPRAGGPLALLDAAPAADVVFCAHTGFEGATSLGALWRGGLVGRRVRVAFWRVPAAQIPAGGDARADWLFAQWERIDVWLAQRSA